MAKGLSNWVVISTVAMLLAVALIALAVLLFADKQGNSPTRLMTMAEVRAVLGPPDTLEVLRRTQCWTYGPQRDFTEAKVCFGERGRLAWYAWGNRQPPNGTSPPAALFP